MDISNLSRQSLWTNILAVATQTLRSIAQKRFSTREVLRQLEEFGWNSLGIIVFCVSFVGIIIVLEYSYHMRLLIGNDSLIPSFAMIMLTRELAPVVTALLLVSKFGASVAAELGAMKTTEQLDAYRLLGLSPIDLFVSPRVLAASLATLMLSVVSLFVAVLGAWGTAVFHLGFSAGDFLRGLFVFVELSDLTLMVVKSVLFGASIPIISATLGFRCRHGAEGVGLTTTDAVVTNSMWIIILDFFLTYGYSLTQ